MKYLILPLIVLGLLCGSACASETINLTKDPIRVGVVFTSDNFDIPDELADMVTNLFGNALAKTRTTSIIRFDRINDARKSLGFSNDKFSSPVHLSEIGKKANVHFIVVTKIIYDLSTEIGRAGVEKLLKVDTSKLIKKQKPKFDVTVVDCVSAKIVFDRNLKIDLFTSEMKKALIAGTVVGGSTLGLGSIDMTPLKKLAEKLAPVMETAIKEATLLSVQYKSDDTDGVINTVVDLLVKGQTHDKNDIKAAVMKALSNDIQNNDQIDGIIDKALEIRGKSDTQDKAEIKAALVQALNENENPENNSYVIPASTSYAIHPGKPAIPLNEDGKIIVGIMPFQNSNEDIEQEQAAMVGDVFTQMLSMSDKIKIIGRDVLTDTASENNISFSGYISHETASEIGKLASCDVIIIGYVSEYVSKSKKGGVIIVSKAKSEAKATANVIVINVNTGENILSLSESGRAVKTGSSVSILGIGGKKIKLDSMEGNAVSELSSILSIKITGVLTGDYPMVTNVTKKDITFNIGETLGVKKSVLYRVLTVEGNAEENIAVVKVKNIRANASQAVSAGKKLGKFSLIEKGDIVMPVTVKDSKMLSKEKSFIKFR